MFAHFTHWRCGSLLDLFCKQRHLLSTCLESNVSKIRFWSFYTRELIVHFVKLGLFSKFKVFSFLVEKFIITESCRNHICYKQYVDVRKKYSI